MGVSLVDSAVGANDMPESVRVLSSLPEVDYADLFTLTTDTEATPEQWARAMFGDIPSLAELLIRGIWPPLSAIHRRIVPGLLRDAATRMTASPGADRTSTRRRPGRRR